jgi:two component response regulator
MERAPASAREPIRVLLADDQPLLVQALAKILGSQPDIDVVATAADGHEAAMAADRFTLDVAVLGIQMPRMNGIEAAREITRRQPGVSVVMLTTFDTDDLVRAALQEGVQGFHAGVPHRLGAPRRARGLGAVPGGDRLRPVGVPRADGD